MAAPTSFTTSTSNSLTIYNNTDLSSIFAPNFPYNTDYGTVNFVGTGTYNANYFKEMNNNSTTANSFTKSTNNNIVSTGIDTTGNSYFQFTRNGMYNLKFSYNLTNMAANGVTINSGQTFNYYIRFTTNSDTSFTNVDNLSYYYIESNGNSSNSTSTFATPQSLLTNNPIFIYSTNYNSAQSNAPFGYPVFESKYYTTTASTTTGTITPAINFYTISITFLVPSASVNTPYYIYPQYVSTSTNVNSAWSWTWRGNWSATKLYDSSSVPPFPDTNYKISNGTDLKNIFASIYPQNSQFGVVNFTAINPTNAVYMNMNNNGSNSFISTGGNFIITTSILNGASYFNFDSSGIFNLTMSYSLDSIAASSGTVSAYTTTMYMRLNNSNSTTTSISIPFNFDDTFSLSNNGNSSDVNDTISSLDDINLIDIYRQTDTAGYSAGYPILRSKYNNLSASPTAYPRKNIYTLSITFIVMSTLTIYPQYYIDKTTSFTWKWSGNWIVTKISNL
jgi:hypothetical protein